MLREGLRRRPMDLALPVEVVATELKRGGSLRLAVRTLKCLLKDRDKQCRSRKSEVP